MSLFLYALGAGAAVNVVVAAIGRLLRASGVRADLSGEAVILGVATLILAAGLGAAARRALAHRRLAPRRRVRAGIPATPRRS